MSEVRYEKEYAAIKEKLDALIQLNQAKKLGCHVVLPFGTFGPPLSIASFPPRFGARLLSERHAIQKNGERAFEKMLEKQGLNPAAIRDSEVQREKLARYVTEEYVRASKSLTEMFWERNVEGPIRAIAWPPMPGANWFLQALDQLRRILTVDSTAEKDVHSYSMRTIRLDVGPPAPFDLDLGTKTAGATAWCHLSSKNWAEVELQSELGEAEVSCTLDREFKVMSFRAKIAGLDGQIANRITGWVRPGARPPNAEGLVKLNAEQGSYFELNPLTGDVTHNEELIQRIKEAKEKEITVIDPERDFRDDYGREPRDGNWRDPTPTEDRDPEAEREREDREGDKSRDRDKDRDDDRG